MSISPQLASPFFSLPGEIRERIQRFALLPRDDEELSTMGAPAGDVEVIFRSYENVVPPIMRACKRMYSEMSPFALTEVLLYDTPGIMPQKPKGHIICHGNLRYERIRLIHLVDTTENFASISAVPANFLERLLRHCPQVEQLHIAFCGGEFPQDAPDWAWLASLLQGSSLKQVHFEGSIPDDWLDTLAQASEDCVQFFNNGVRRKAKYRRERTIEEIENDAAAAASKQEAQQGTNAPVSFQVVYDHASRFD